MKVGYVVLYVNDPEGCRRFWVDQVGMVVKETTPAGDFAIHRVGFADQDFAFELVPLALMQENPDGLDLATPSICFRCGDLAATRGQLIAAGVTVTEINEHAGMLTFAFCDPEDRWFAMAGGA